MAFHAARAVRAFGIFLLAAAAALLAVTAGRAAHSSPGGEGSPSFSEYQVKAGFIYNFAKLVTWPPAGGAKGPMRLCIAGHDPFGEARRVLDGKSVGPRALEVVPDAALAELPRCQIVFVSQTDAPPLRELLAALDAQPVLTVADSPGFAARGVIINFYPAGERVRFEINVDAARRAGLQIDARLLKLARIVRDGEGGGE